MRRRSWRRINPHFQPFKNGFLSRSLDWKEPKNVYFLEKNYKKRRSVRGSAPRPPRCNYCMLLQHFIRLYYLTRLLTIEADVLLLQLFFTSNFAVLLMGAQNYFLFQDAGYSSYATGRPSLCFSMYKGF